MKIWRSWKVFSLVEIVLIAIALFSYYASHWSNITYKLPILQYCSWGPTCTPGTPCPLYELTNTSCIPLISTFIFPVMMAFAILNLAAYVLISVHYSELNKQGTKEQLPK